MYLTILECEVNRDILFVDDFQNRFCNLGQGGDDGNGDGGSVARRASIIYSADNQKSWKHTFMRQAVPERRTLYECTARRGG